jgi:hypothetical protein
LKTTEFARNKGSKYIDYFELVLFAARTHYSAMAGNKDAGFNSAAACRAKVASYRTIAEHAVNPEIKAKSA